MICKKCKSKKIKKRINYSHGKKSKPIISITCLMCGSTDIDSGRQDKRGRHKR